MNKRHVRQHLTAALGPLMGHRVEDLRMEDLDEAREAMRVCRAEGERLNNPLLVHAAESVLEDLRMERVRRQRKRHQRDRMDGRRD